MRRSTRIALGTLLTAALGLFVARHWLLSLGLDRVLAEVPELARTRQLEVRELGYEKVSLDRWLGASVVEAHAFLARGERTERLAFDVSAPQLQVSLVRYVPPAIGLRAEEVRAAVQGPHLHERFRFEALSDLDVDFREPLPLLEPAQAAQMLLQTLSEILRDGETHTDIAIQGNATFVVGESVHRVAFYTERSRDRTRAVLDQEGLERVVHELELEASADELALIAEHPLRSPQILGFARAAKLEARRVAAEHDAVGEDAYRHVHWSFHLAREFGDAFAKRVTDAHETLPGNSRHERLMDLHNNAIGRRLAGEGVEPAQLYEAIAKQHELVQYPEQVPERLTRRAIEELSKTGHGERLERGRELPE